MVRIELVTVGRELLIGRTLNTNAHWVGKRLAEMGAMIGLISTVDDNLAEISSVLVSCLSRAPEFIVLIGGLGPTYDDMTLRGVAKGLKRKLRTDGRALELMKEHYARKGLADIQFTPSRRKMALLPSGASPLRNEVGTAPGVRTEAGKTVVFCLPGVPAEMRSMFARSVEPEIRESLGTLHRETVRLKVEGMLESEFAPIAGRQVSSHPGSYVKSHPGGVRESVTRLEVDISVVSARKEDAAAEAGEVADAITRDVRAAGARVLTPQPVKER